MSYIESIKNQAADLRTEWESMSAFERDDYAKKNYPNSVASIEAAKVEPVRILRRDLLPPPTSPILLCFLRDEMNKLPEFIEHYRKIGIKKFVFIDNGSVDGTTEFIKGQADADLWHCGTPFHERVKSAAQTKLMEFYTSDISRWFCVVDADEFLVYDECENKNLDEFVAAMQSAGINAVRGQLVDMYDDGKAFGKVNEAGKNILENNPFFDALVAREEVGKHPTEDGDYPFILRNGGPRSRIDGIDPWLTKMPLFLFRKGIIFHAHSLSPWFLNFSPCYLGLLHFKFLPNTVDRFRQVVTEGGYAGGSYEYRCYLAKFEQEPDFSFMCADSRRYESSKTLAAAGIIEKACKL